MSKAEEEFRSLAEAVKTFFESSLIHEFGSARSHKIFQYIRSLKNGAEIPSTVFYGEESASSDNTKAPLFNRYFHSVFIDNDGTTLPTGDIFRGNHSNEFQVTESEVYNVLVNLDTTKAMGLDGIGPNVLKHCALGLLSTSAQVVLDKCFAPFSAN